MSIAFLHLASLFNFNLNKTFYDQGAVSAGNRTFIPLSGQYSFNLWAIEKINSCICNYIDSKQVVIYLSNLD